MGLAKLVKGAAGASKFDMASRFLPRVERGLPSRTLIGDIGK
jgi:hypothetical protein